MYIHQRPEWPNLQWNATELTARLARVHHDQGRLIGQMESLGFSFQQEAVLETLTQDVVKTSQIEGENLDRAAVRSSLASRLGIDIGGVPVVDRHVEGIVAMMLDATGHYAEPLTAERLHGWHAALFPTGRSEMRPIRVGTWRDDRSGPMQVVSGAVGRERVHYEAPEAARVPQEMTAFLSWFEAHRAMDQIVQSGLAHLWFVTIHPFDDGNGRIARAIADLTLARSENSPRRFYSMSAQIQRDRNGYYDALERTQRGSVDVTPWLEWYLDCLGRAMEGARSTLAQVLTKASFWEKMREVPLNPRQRLMLTRLLEGFHGKLTTSKWGVIAKCSQDTAFRDIMQLVESGILVRDTAGGRSTSYLLNPSLGVDLSSTPSHNRNKRLPDIER